MKKIDVYKHRVQYYETDGMAIVHHSNHIRWFEEARSDFMDQIGVPYRETEARGIVSPVVDMYCKYHTVTKYDDVVLIYVKMDTFTGAKFTCSYRVVDEATGELRATGHSTHCFLDSASNRPVSLKRNNRDIYDIMCEYIGIETE